MPAGVRVDVSDATVISALNTPGGGVYEWRNDTEAALMARAVSASPINHILNTRGKFHDPPGGYIASWVTTRFGNGHRVGFEVENFSDHAIFVEFGREPSSSAEKFSWAKGTPPGAIKTAKFGTKGWPAQHVLRDATNAVMMEATGGAYSPLP